MATANLTLVNDEQTGQNLARASEGSVEPGEQQITQERIPVRRGKHLDVDAVLEPFGEAPAAGSRGDAVMIRCPKVA